MTIREKVLKVWEELEGKIMDLEYENSNYRKCFSLKDLGLPSKIIANKYGLVSDILLNREVKTSLIYSYDNRMFSYASLVILGWGPFIEEVD